MAESPAPFDVSPARLERLLDGLDMTNTDLANLCAVDRSTVHRWLKAETTIPVAVIRLLDIMVEVRDLVNRCQVYWHRPLPVPGDQP
jgi:hypothetical protein